MLVSSYLSATLFTFTVLTCYVTLVVLQFDETSVVNISHFGSTTVLSSQIRPIKFICFEERVESFISAFSSILSQILTTSKSDFSDKFFWRVFLSHPSLTILFLPVFRESFFKVSHGTHLPIDNNSY